MFIREGLIILPRNQEKRFIKKGGGFPMKYVIGILAGAFLSLLFAVLWNSLLGMKVDSWITQKFVRNPEAGIAYKKGRKHYLKFGTEDFEQAKLHYTHAIDLAPDNPLPYAGLAELYAAWSYLNLNRLKRTDTKAFKQQALEYAITAMSLNNRLFKTKRAIAFSLCDFQKKEENQPAQKRIEEALRLRPKDEEARYIKWVSSGRDLKDPLVTQILNKHDYDFILPMIHIGGMFISSRNARQAASYFEKAITINEECALAHFGIGSSLIKTNPEKAEYHLTRSLELDQQISMAYNNLGVHYASRGNYRKALSSLKCCYENTKSILTLDMIGFVHLELDQLEKAKECWEKVCDLSRKDDFLSNLGLSLYYFSKKNYEKAKNHFIVAKEEGNDIGENPCDISSTEERGGIIGPTEKRLLIEIANRFPEICTQ